MAFQGPTSDRLHTGLIQICQGPVRSVRTLLDGLPPPRVHRHRAGVCIRRAWQQQVQGVRTGVPPIPEWLTCTDCAHGRMGPPLTPVYLRFSDRAFSLELLTASSQKAPMPA